MTFEKRLNPMLLPEFILRLMITTGDRLPCRPRLEFLLSVNGEVAPHPIVTETAELRAGNLPLTRFGGGKPNGDAHPGDDILLHAHHG